MLFSQVQKRRCAQCWGRVVMQYNAEIGDFEIVCPRGCEPGGHVSEDYVERRLAENEFDHMRVAANYPDWRDDTSEQISVDDANDLLFGG